MEQFSHITVDAFVGFGVFVSFVIGWIRGATREIFSVISWIGGVYLTILVFPHAKGIARSYISHGLIADFVTSCILFILFLTLLSLLNYFFSSCIKKSALNTTDKALGGIFGIARGAVLLAVLEIVLFQYVWTETPDWIKRSNSHPIISSISNFIILVLPDKLQDKIVSHLPILKRESLMSFVTDSVIGNLDDASREDLLQDVEDGKILAENAVSEDEQKEDEQKIEEETDLEVQGLPLEDKDNEQDDSRPPSQSAKSLATLKPKKNTDDGGKKPGPEERFKNSGRPRQDMSRILDQADR
ncbi:MAG: CvpA family protein [Holosporales bacterium]|jgi:membrane protein required for colicin V production|nr:CvpA family protein [Holosporales bacterium]